MDETVLRAMTKWPNVPAVYGWLALDRRGNWLIKRETIGNDALNAFISRNYLHDDAGCWFFQNGPQRVFADLDYTPYIYRVTNDVNKPLALATHIGNGVNTLLGAWIDEQGTVIIHTDQGIGIVHDQDLDPLLLASMVDANGNIVEESVFDELVEIIEHQHPIPLWLKFRDSNVRLEPIMSKNVSKKFGFHPHPVEPSSPPLIA
ncbi:MAG: DUF2946 family protein [Burkholderiales bacterium]